MIASFRVFLLLCFVRSCLAIRGPPPDTACESASSACLQIQLACIEAARRHNIWLVIPDRVEAESGSFSSVIGIHRLVLLYQSRSALDALEKAKAALTERDCRRFREDCLKIWEYCESTPECWDQHRCCEFWAKGLQCKTNPGYMETDCRGACQLCMPYSKWWAEPKSVVCINYDIKCPFWAFTGHCDIPEHKDWMTNNCRASCNVCHLFTEEALQQRCIQPPIQVTSPATPRPAPHIVPTTQGQVPSTPRPAPGIVRTTQGYATAYNNIRHTSAPAPAPQRYASTYNNVPYTSAPAPAPVIVPAPQVYASTYNNVPYTSAPAPAVVPAPQAYDFTFNNVPSTSAPAVWIVPTSQGYKSPNINIPNTSPPAPAIVPATQGYDSTLNNVPYAPQPAPEIIPATQGYDSTYNNIPATSPPAPWIVPTTQGYESTYNNVPSNPAYKAPTQSHINPTPILSIYSQYLGFK